MITTYYSRTSVARTLINEWMTCSFLSFLTVFESYQDDGWMIMKAVFNGTPFAV